MLTRKLDGTQDGKNFACYRCSGLDGHDPDEYGAINLRWNAYRKIGHLSRVCKSTKKPQCRSNWKGNQWLGQNPKKSDKEVRNLRAEWINEETISDDESEPVY